MDFTSGSCFAAEQYFAGYFGVPGVCRAQITNYFETVMTVAFPFLVSLPVLQALFGTTVAETRIKLTLLGRRGSRSRSRLERA